MDWYPVHSACWSLAHYGPPNHRTSTLMYYVNLSVQDVYSVPRYANRVTVIFQPLCMSVYTPVDAFRLFIDV
jgi:hypothetical protein